MSDANRIVWAGDGMQSLISKMGDPSRDKGAAVVFGDREFSDQELVSAYSSNWIARKAVDIPAQDATRKWRQWNNERDTLIEQEEVRLGVRRKVEKAVISARLFGGAALYIGTRQEASEPLDPGTIGRGGLQYVTLLIRRELTADALDQDPLSPTYGQPPMYYVGGPRGRQAVHPSRLAIFHGDAVADPWLQTDGSRWGGQSVLKATRDAITDASATNANIAALIHEANVDVIGIPELGAKLAAPDGERKLLQRFTTAAAGKGITGMLILDALEEYSRRPAAFADMSPVMETFALFAAAANDIPATRFLARSPTGLVATGGHDMANYHDKLQSIQELELTPALANLDACLVRSAGAGEDVDYSWRPLEQMNEKELAEIGKLTAETLAIMRDLGLTDEEIRELTIHRQTENGAFPHLESIAAETNAALAIGGGEVDEPDEDEPDEEERGS